MTRNRSNRGRHRRRRDQPAEGGMPGEAASPSADAAQAPSPDVPHVAGPEEALPIPTDRGPGRRPDPNRGQRGPAPDGPRSPRSGPGDQGQRPPSRGNRRRPQRRHQMAPMPGEVLRPRAPVTGGGEPIQKRTLAELDGENGPVLGCPMLSRTRIGLPVTGGQPAPRCALAWAVHSEREARYCMETHDLTQCWQAHPERLEEIRARLGERTPEPVGD